MVLHLFTFLVFGQCQNPKNHKINRIFAARCPIV